MVHVVLTDVLEHQIKQDIENGLTPFLVVGTCGSTELGAIDPIDKIADLCEQYEVIEP